MRMGSTRMRGIKTMLLIGFGGAASAAMADPIQFHFALCLSNTNAINASTANQYYFTVTDGGTSNGHNAALFNFYNAGPAASSITDIYFQDGTLLDLQSVAGQTLGVSFAPNATPTNP